LIAGLMALSGARAQYPQAEISNGVLKARVLLPDPERGYYRGSRFDWSGVVESLTYQGHEFFGKWFPRYDPLLHDAIMGPVEEFRSGDGALGFAQAQPPNGLFLKIGVGMLRKQYDEPYNFARGYALVNPGRRVVRTGKEQVEFLHEISDGEGYAYEYRKTLRLPRRKAQLVLEHALKNTGRKVIDTDVYNHDFYMLDHAPTSPDIRVKFPFAPIPKGEFTKPARIEGNEIRYERALNDPPDSSYGELIGYGDTAVDNDVRVENTKTGIGVRETGDRPVSKLFFWSVRTTVCPEFYIKVHVEPGKTFKWKTTYEFYLLGTKTKDTGEGTS
jgi:hypothetical protein